MQIRRNTISVTPPDERTMVNWEGVFAENFGKFRACSKRRCDSMGMWDYWEDAVQETILRVVGAHLDERNDNVALRYFYVVLHNVIVDERRRRNRVDTESELGGDDGDWPTFSMDGQAGTTPNPAENLRETTVQQALELAFALLPRFDSGDEQQVENYLQAAWMLRVEKDLDDVDASNLTRSILFTADNIDRPKAQVVVDATKRIESDMHIVGHRATNVICDRYLFSTLAYHIALGLTLDPALVPTVLMPNRTFLLVADEAERLSRLAGRQVGKLA